MDRPLLLNGFMATGKTSVGRRIAELTGAPFEDLDARVEARTGATVAEIFAGSGEPEFRRLEQEELRRTLDQGGRRVVALGGGALSVREARLRALSRATVVTLSAPVETLLARVANDAARPLLAVPDPEARIRELLEVRGPGYAECHARLDTGRLDVDAAARAAIGVWERAPIAVAAGERSYRVEIGRDIAPVLLPELAGAPTATLLVTDGNVDRLFGDRISHVLPGPLQRVVNEPGEESKNEETLQEIWRGAAVSGLDRSALVVALGGGVVSDLAGFAAATWMRGIRWLVVPTTLLAMVDASVGGKTAIDFRGVKNVVGAFWQPSGVVCDVAFLATEPERGYVSALAEVVKTALIGDPRLFELLEAESPRVLAREPEVLLEIVRRSIAVKAAIVSEDEREAGRRAVLNLGHTLGHALEASQGFGRWSHGEAVSLGLIAALRVSERLGLLDGSERFRALLGRLGLPVELEPEAVRSALALVARDKKRRGKELRFIAVRAVGDVTPVDLELDELGRLLAP